MNDVRKVTVEIKTTASSVTKNLLKSFSLSSSHVSYSPFPIRINSRIKKTRHVMSNPKFLVVTPAIEATAKKIMKTFKAPVIIKSVHVRLSKDLKTTKAVKNSSKIVKQLNVMIPQTKNCLNELISMTNYQQMNDDHHEKLIKQLFTLSFVKIFH